MTQAVENTMDFFVIGAQKCATSWLYLCLRDHPEILLHSKKDENNYIGGPRYRERGHEWFDGLYPPRERPFRRGAVSVDYLYDTAALEYVLTRYPAARYIVCLRNPFDRMASAHQFLARKGLIPYRPLRESLADCLRLYNAGSAEPVTQLLTRSLYARQLQPFLSHDATAQLLVIGYETLCESPASTLRRVFSFIGVDAAFVPKSFGMRPKHNANWPVLTHIERTMPKSRLMAKSMDLLNQWACRMGLGRPPLPYEDAQMEALRQVLEPDVAALDRLLSQIPRDQILFRRTAKEAWGFGQALENTGYPPASA